MGADGVSGIFFALLQIRALIGSIRPTRAQAKIMCRIKFEARAMTSNDVIEIELFQHSNSKEKKSKNKNKTKQKTVVGVRLTSSARILFAVQFVVTEKDPAFYHVLYEESYENPSPPVERKLLRFCRDISIHAVQYEEEHEKVKRNCLRQKKLRTVRPNPIMAFFV